MSHDYSKESIRIGTLVRSNAGNDVPGYVRSILPHGFESISLFFWQTCEGVDLQKLAAEVFDVLDGTGVVVSSLGVFGNPLGDQPMDRETLTGWQKLIDSAELFGCDIVGGFTGRVRGESIDASLPTFAKVFGPLAKRAADRGVRIAFENCDMDGTWQTGDWNIAHNPAAWEMMFNELPAENVGLEWEPCHQLVNLIDPLPQIPEWIDRIFHVHGKDATIHWDIVRRYGIHGLKSFAFHRTPGFGDSNWTDIISELRSGGYTGFIDIEGWHDPVYRDELEMTGQVHALNYLKRCRGGEFVPNP